MEHNKQVQEEIILKHSKNWLLLHLIFGFLLTITIIGAFIGIPLIVLTILRYSTESFTLHANSLVVKRGVFTRNTNEIPCSKINNINTYRNMLGLVFGYGDIGIYSANASEPEVFKNIANPGKVKDAIKLRMDSFEDSQPNNK